MLVEVIESKPRPRRRRLSFATTLAPSLEEDEREGEEKAFALSPSQTATTGFIHEFSPGFLYVVSSLFPRPTLFFLVVDGRSVGRSSCRWSFLPGRRRKNVGVPSRFEFFLNDIEEKNFFLLLLPNLESTADGRTPRFPPTSCLRPQLKAGPVWIA